MTNIVDITNMKDGTVIDSIQVKVAAVYERKTGTGRDGNGSVQNCELQDSAGNSVRAGVWDHPDLTPLKGQEVILHSSTGKRGFGGVSVKFSDFKKKNELSVSRQGQFQHLEVFKSNAAATSPAKAVSSPMADVAAPAHTDTAKQDKPSSKAILGVTVGMSLNNACNILAGNGFNPETFENDLHILASKIIKVGQKLGAGELIENTNPF